MVEKYLRSVGLVENIFKPEALEVIYSISEGSPRVVYTLATASLMYACPKKTNLHWMRNLYFKAFGHCLKFVGKFPQMLC
jgi:hypothetical protein